MSPAVTRPLLIAVVGLAVGGGLALVTDRDGPPPDSAGASPSTSSSITSAGLASPSVAPATTPAPAAPAGRTVSLLFTGDIVIENPVLDNARATGAAHGTRYDFSGLFGPITPLVSSYDLAVCQMEMPIGRADQEPGNQGRSPYGGNRIIGPFELAAGVAATGFDRCTTASNHSYDTGDEGVDSTIDALEAAGVSWSGTARTPEEVPPPVFEVAGVRIAHLSYTRYTNNGQPVDPWRLAYVDHPATVAADVTAARAAGAELVIVSLHLAQELDEQPDPDNRWFTEELLRQAPRIDAVIEHGPHVVQPFELIDGTPVWWSIGNLVSGMARPNPVDRYTDPRTRDGIAAGLTFTETAPGRWTVATESIVLCNEQASRIVRRGTEAMADPLLSTERRQEMTDCVARTREAIPGAS